MKLFTIAASVLLSYIHSGEAAAARLRINTKAKEATSEEVVESDDVPASRKRVSTHVKEGQRFFILDGVPILYEDPSKAPVTVTGVYWLCQPITDPGLNGDGIYVSVVAHVNGWRAPSFTDAAKSAGATGIGSDGFTTHGDTASWLEEGGYYNEFVVDFGDTTIYQIKGDLFVAYETSPPGTTGGLTACE